MTHLEIDRQTGEVYRVFGEDDHFTPSEPPCRRTPDSRERVGSPIAMQSIKPNPHTHEIKGLNRFNKG